MQYFNIQMASQLSGVATATIRAWEKRYQVVTPARAENKHRLYSQTDIEKLSLLAKLTDFGQNIGKIAKIDLEELKVIYSTLLKKPYRQQDIILSPQQKIYPEKSLSSLSLAVSSFKLDIISHELKKIKDSLTPREIALNILSPLSQMIEQKITTGELNQSHQFALNEMISNHFSYLLNQRASSSLSPQIILAAPLQESSPLNLLAMALLCLHHEKSFFYLGHSVPARVLADIINEVKSETLILSVGRYQLNHQLNLDHYLDELNRLLRHYPHLLIEGPLNIKKTLMRQNSLFVQGPWELELWLQSQM